MSAPAAADGEWSTPEPPDPSLPRHVLTPKQRAELDRRLAALPGHIAAGRCHSAEEIFAMIERMRIEQGG